MERIIHYIIEQCDQNLTILDFLKRKEYTRNVIVQLKKTENGILLNEHWAYVNERLQKGDLLTITLTEGDLKSDIKPVYFPLSIIYEDEDILVINKPANMPIHPSIHNYENTLANAVMYYFNETNPDMVFRCMNRLDRDTTGLTIIAKNALSAGILNNQVAKRQIHRTYIAVCEGQTSVSGTIDAPIARVCDSTIERCVNIEKGESAITHYKTLRYDSKKDLSFVQLQLETGRTHQIRVHMKYIGHPLIGDFLYNPNTKYINRQALHSASLTFFHPISKAPLYFEAPLPADIQALFPLF